MVSQKVYKFMKTINSSNLWIVSMIPGDRKVAGCLFSFFGNFWGVV